MTARNNEDRVGAAPAADSPAPIVQQSTETFSFATPTEFVELPSEGRFYPDDHPMHGIDTVEIKYMTAKDEDILTSRSLIKKGLAIERLLKNIVVDKTINTDQLLIGDKNAIVIASRTTGYGSEYKVNVACPVCGDIFSNEFNLEELSSNRGGLVDLLTKEHNVREAEDLGNFIIPLPSSKVEVEVKLLTGVDEKKLGFKAEKKKKHKLPESPLTDQLKAFVVSVNGNTTPKVVEAFIDSMPAKDSKHLRLIYQRLAPNIDMKQFIECDSCDSVTEVEVPLTAEFFWPK